MIDPPARRTARAPRRPGWRAAWGFVLGAVAAFGTYWIGAAIIAWDDVASAPTATNVVLVARPFQTFTYWEVALVAVGGFVGAAVARSRWRGAGLLSYVGLVSLVVGYIWYSLMVSIPRVPDAERWLSYVLLAAESGGLTLVVVSSLYSLDVATRRQWSRAPGSRAWNPEFRPGVAFIVPVYNEPVSMVEQTVAHLVRQDYPGDRFYVVVADDTPDPQARAELAAVCERLGAYHFTREDRRGFKAGAINAATRRLPLEVRFVAVIDADYWVAPTFLRSVMGFFVDDRLGFVQTPQAYRNSDESFLTHQYERAEAYFYHAMMPSRNEDNAIIFCGTMGVLRRAALDSVGGFAEDQICEDADVSVRLAIRGWDSLYVSRSFGRGLMPAVFDAYKKQFHRWSFGNVRILRSHLAAILRSRMSLRQKFDFISSSLHWFDGIFTLTIALVLLDVGLSPFTGTSVVTHHQRELALLALVPIFLVADGLLRLHLALSKRGHARFRETLLVQGMWSAIKFTNMLGALKSTLGFRMAFIRTPKSPSSALSRPRALVRAVRLTKVESLVGVSLLGVAIADVTRLPSLGGTAVSLLLPLWLGLYALFFLCAPIYAYLSYRTLVPLEYEPLPISAGAPVLAA